MIGSEIIHFKRVDSTSNYIATLIKETKAVNGLVILADEQTEGRGQRGAKWQSLPGENLLFSFYIEYNKLEVKQQQCITHATSLAIQKCLDFFDIESKIKWPNDIVVGNKKIAGILIENQFQGNKIKSSNIGIGLNVLQQVFETLNSTSIKNESSKEIKISTVLNRLIFELNQHFDLISQGAFQVLLEKYTTSMWLLDKVSEYETEKGNRFYGTIIGTDELGKLVIQHLETQENEHFGLKEIKFIERNVQ